MRRFNRLLRHALLVLAGALPAGAAIAGDKQVYWGDLHTHTSYSMDAYVLFNQTTPEDAYRFARGHPVTLTNGESYRLERPLDFAAVTDHAEYFGLMYVCRTQPALPYCIELATAARENSKRGFLEYFLPTLLRGDRNCQVDNEACDRAEESLWQRSINAAEAANEPGEFTAFIANEWTQSPDNLHWHRNLIYASSTVPARAINSFDQPSQEALWAGLDEQCAQVDGCDVIAIPHNSNIGMGGTFATEGHDARMLRLRARFEKLVEIHQHKGASECYPGSQFTDEDCTFEITMPIPIRNELREEPRELTVSEEAEIASGYVRDALAKGLGLASKQGVNAFEYGFVGATDSHSGRPGDAEEAGWKGSLGQWDEDRAGQLAYRTYNPGGLTGIWAARNTRASLFDALRRREVYATSGPRMTVRFDYVAEPATQGCTRGTGPGVPMGSTITGPLAQGAPTFSVEVLKDRVPIVAIDMIKLYYRDGRVEQQVTRIAEDRAGRQAYCLDWQDTGYDADTLALWYVRVLEAPTLRWSGDRTTQERAWTSPIWYHPPSTSTVSNAAPAGE